MTSIYIYFNEKTRIPTFYSESKLDTAKQPFKEVVLDDLGINDGNFNIARYRWEGDFDTGHLIDLFKEKKAIVTEEEITKKFYGIFFRKYPLEEALFNIIESASFADGSNGKKMQDFLDHIKKKKIKEIEFYQQSTNHIFESEKDQEKRVENSFKI